MIGIVVPKYHFGTGGYVALVNPLSLPSSKVNVHTVREVYK